MRRLLFGEVATVDDFVDGVVVASHVVVSTDRLTLHSQLLKHSLRLVFRASVDAQIRARLDTSTPHVIAARAASVANPRPHH